MHVTELPGQQENAFEKVVAPAFDAKETRQLRHRDGQAGAGLEAHKDAVADQLHQHAQPQQPGEKAEPCHSKSSKTGDLGVTLHVTLSHRPHRSRNHQRDRGSRPDGKLTRGSKQGIAETAQHVTIDADLRRQAGKAA